MQKIILYEQNVHTFMMKARWQCNVCGRNFSRVNQPHNCQTYSIEDHHFKKGNHEVVSYYRQLISKIQEFGYIDIEPMKSIILVKKKSQFCSIQIQRNNLKIIFRLFSELSSHRFEKSSIQADGMHYYQLRVAQENEIDNELINWLELAYKEN